MRFIQDFLNGYMIYPIYHTIADQQIRKYENKDIKSNNNANEMKTKNCSFLKSVEISVKREKKKETLYNKQKTN